MEHAVSRDSTDSSRAETITAVQQQILHLIVTNGSLVEMLEHIALAVEEHNPGLICSILRMDEDGTHLRQGAGPSLPAAYNQSLDGVAIGPTVGSCGTAAFFGTPVVVTDIALDPLWTDFRALALSHGLRACWSYPILETGQADGATAPKVLGTFAIYSRTPRAPEAATDFVPRWATNLAGVALQFDRTQRALRDSEHRYHTLATASPVGIFRTDAQGERTYVNQRWCAIAGIPLSEVVAGRWIHAIHPDDLAHWQEKWSESVAQRRPFHHEYRFVTPAGVVTWVLGQAEPEHRADGTFVGFVGTITDITDRKDAEARLLASTERFRTLARVTNDAVWDWDLSSNRVWWNDGVTALFGYTLKDSEADPAWWLERVHPDERAKVEADFFAVVASQQLSWEDEYRFRREDGTYADVFDRGIVVRDERGEATRMLGAMIDITRLRLAEAELRELNRSLEERVSERTAELEAAIKELEAFSYSVSHDLRAPLRAIDGFSRMVVEECGASLSPEARGNLDVVRRSSQQMGALIDDLLAFSRLGRQALRKQTVSSERLARHCVAELLSVPDADKGRAVEVTYGGLAPCEGDPALLKQVWLNLLGNALKYTRKRSPARIEVGCTVAPGGITYFVRDNGVGFDMRYSKKVFGVFQRLHRAEEYEGTVCLTG